MFLRHTIITLDSMEVVIIRTIMVIIIMASLIMPFPTASEASIDRPVDIRDFKTPPYFFRLFGGGNCVWFAWEMAYQIWGVCLPVAGSALKWINLGNLSISQKDMTYVLGLSERPYKNSIMIVQPDDSVSRGNRGLFRPGHVAWVVEAPDSKRIKVLESSIFPNKSRGGFWHGCWWDTGYYSASEAFNPRFLYIKSIQIQNRVLLSGMNINVTQVADGTYQVSAQEEGYITITGLTPATINVKDQAGDHIYSGILPTNHSLYLGEPVLNITLPDYKCEYTFLNRIINTFKFITTSLFLLLSS
ncbi:MAG: CHAP domain-containing protein [Syntrophomonadaceae bacterium]